LALQPQCRGPADQVGVGICGDGHAGAAAKSFRKGEHMLTDAGRNPAVGRKPDADAMTTRDHQPIVNLGRSAKKDTAWFESGGASVGEFSGLFDGLDLVSHVKSVLSLRPDQRPGRIKSALARRFQRLFEPSGSTIIRRTGISWG